MPEDAEVTAAGIDARIALVESIPEDVYRPTSEPLPRNKAVTASDKALIWWRELTGGTAAELVAELWAAREIRAAWGAAITTGQQLTNGRYFLTDQGELLTYRDRRIRFGTVLTSEQLGHLATGLPYEACAEEGPAEAELDTSWLPTPLPTDRGALHALRAEAITRLPHLSGHAAVQLQGVLTAINGAIRQRPAAPWRPGTFDRAPYDTELARITDLTTKVTNSLAHGDPKLVPKLTRRILAICHDLLERAAADCAANAVGETDE